MDTPACDPASLTFILPMPAMRTKSEARVRKAANVDGNGMAPRLASPIAAPTIACSAIWVSTNRSGCAVSNVWLNVELPTSASSATMRESTAPSAASASPQAVRVATWLPGS